MRRPKIQSWMMPPLLAAAVIAAAAEPDLIIADFEGETYGDWAVTGEAFGAGPARGTLPNQMPVAGFAGSGLVNSYFGGDGATGTLTSPAFTIARPFINFLIGGGAHPERTCINLRVDGEVARTATGPNAEPGGSENLDWRSWDVRDLEGRAAVLEIVDRETGGWGHIDVDQIVQSETKLEAEPARSELAIERACLHLPIDNGGAKRRMRYLAGDATVREFEIELADGFPDFWVFSDVTAFAGQTLTIEVDRLPAGSRGLSSIVQADEAPGAEQLYREKYRPQFHFSSRRGWNNDPNGLVYYRGEYHLFYQHNPYGRAWGNMHWGHAVSPDLVHWEELPVALYPRAFGDWVFSGSAAIDWGNTAGFKTGAEDVIVAAFTSTGRGECVAYSNDRGRTFAEFEGNPVVRHSGRDPKIIWYAPGNHWVMAVYDEEGDSRGIAFYASPDLKRWERTGRVDGYFECPELFELPIDRDPANRRWVLYAADGAYAVGRFDGKVFTSQQDKQQNNYGNCFYASQTFSDIPADDGRRIQIGWGRIDPPGMPFNQCMLFPCELTLRGTPDGVRMFTRPVREIAMLHERSHVWQGLTIAPGENPLAELAGDLFDIRAEIEPGQALQVGFIVRGVPVVYDCQAQTLTCHGCSAPVALERDRLRLQLLVDRTSIEIFAHDGRVYMPVGTVPPDADRSLAVLVQGAPARWHSLQVHELASAWPQPAAP